MRRRVCRWLEGGEVREVEEVNQVKDLETGTVVERGRDWVDWVCG